MPNEVYTICPKCNQKVKEKDMMKFCRTCGYEFSQNARQSTSPPPAAPAETQQNQRPSLGDDWKELKSDFKEFVQSGKETISSVLQLQKSQSTEQPITRAASPTMPTPQTVNAPTQRLNDQPKVHAPKLKPILLLPNGQNIAVKYRILKGFHLKTCNFYAAGNTVQAQSGQLDQPNFLIRETWTSPTVSVPLNLADLQKLASKHPNIAGHIDVFQNQDKTYVVTPYPKTWERVTPQPLEQALIWVKQIGQILMILNTNQYGKFPSGDKGREAIIIVNGNARLVDLTVVQQVSPADSKGDVRVLAGLFNYITTGGKATPDAASVNPNVRAVLQRASKGNYTDMQTLLNDLESSVHKPIYQRALRQSVGTMTHVGSVRDHNEDFIGSFYFGLDQSGSVNPVGLYIVADGMGGQSAGELASEGTVIQAFVQFIESTILPDLKRNTRRLTAGEDATPAGQIASLVQQANNLVYQANQKANTNRGTTITAVLIIGSQAYVANVGDSRTYLLRDGKLKQITDDHSLVYSLYKADQISTDELYTHPRKNEIYRSLGDKEHIKVDTFPIELVADDQLLLCSDGLWEMVRDPIIQKMMLESATPQKACDLLIQEANVNGGEDNISAIIVSIE